jgi:hypothetical protein
MKLSKTSGAVLAATAAAMILGGLASVPSARAADGKLGHCVGVNACKGHSSCKSSANSCAGLNSCKGQGYVGLTAEQCKQLDGKFEPAAG